MRMHQGCTAMHHSVSTGSLQLSSAPLGHVDVCRLEFQRSIHLGATTANTTACWHCHCLLLAAARAAAVVHETFCCTSRVHTGVIVNADQPADKRPKLQGAAFKGTPTRILLLRNMVGPGEVDEDLEEEVSCGAGGVLLYLQVQ